MTKPISTVNVLTTSGGVPQSIKSWKDTPKGNKEAEKYFTEVITNSGCPADDVDAAIEDGYFEAEPSGFNFFLIHSD